MSLFMSILCTRNLITRKVGLDGCIITIDAMGTQRKIAETIIDKQADYILARVTATREIHDKKSSEVRLYISSVEADAEIFNSFIRQLWGVENTLHWTLDVTFREDAQRKTG